MSLTTTTVSTLSGISTRIAQLEINTACMANYINALPLSNLPSQIVINEFGISYNGVPPTLAWVELIGSEMTIFNSSSTISNIYFESNTTIRFFNMQNYTTPLNNTVTYLLIKNVNTSDIAISNDFEGTNLTTGSDFGTATLNPSKFLLITILGNSVGYFGTSQKFPPLSG